MNIISFYHVDLIEYFTYMIIFAIIFSILLFRTSTRTEKITAQIHLLYKKFVFFPSNFIISESISPVDNSIPLLQSVPKWKARKKFHEFDKNYKLILMLLLTTFNDRKQRIRQREM